MPSVVSICKGFDPSEDKFMQVLEKKIRNLEKRKTKLMALVEQKRDGKVLDPDQIASVNSLPLIESNLEQLRELLPQFKSIVTDTEKAKKRQTRRDEAKKTEFELKRVKGTLSVLHMMSLLTLELKESLLNGLNGLTLTEDEMAILDGFYRATDTSTVSWSELDASLDTASSHIIGLLDVKDKEAFDTIRYKQISELFERLKEHHVFDPDYEPPAPEQPPEEETPKEEEEEEEVPEPEEAEEEEAPVEEEITPEEEEEEEDETEDIPDEPVEPVEPATESEEKLLNGDVAPQNDETMVHFMHDSHLDRSESQLSPHATEFQPGQSSPDHLEDSGEKATFGAFSQDEPSPDVDPVVSDPAVVAWSTGTPVEDAPAQPSNIWPSIDTEKVEGTPANAPETESTNPWSKKSTIDWGNTSLPSESESPSGNVWTAPPANTWTSNGAPDPPAPTSWGAEEEEEEEEQPAMKDQTTQKVDDDGFTEQRRRGSNRTSRYNTSSNRGGGGSGGGGGGGSSYRTDSRGSSRGSTRGGSRYSTSRRYNSDRGGRDSRSDRPRDNSDRPYSGGYGGGDWNNVRRGTSTTGRGTSTTGRGGGGGGSSRGGNSGYRSNYRGSPRGSSRGSERGGRPQPANRATPVAS